MACVFKCLCLRCGVARRAAARALVRAAAKKEKMMWETLREAIDEEMEADPTVLVMGKQAIPLTAHTAAVACSFSPGSL